MSINQTAQAQVYQPDAEADQDLKEGLVDEHEHYSQRAPWLRAFVLGANDGLVSISAVMLGIAGGSEELRTMRLASLSAWIAGALSMAVGEYVSVSSQRDTEEADVQKERDMQEQGPEARRHELDELTQIYINRGLNPVLARQVAEELTAKDVIRAHARDELGIDLDEMANPVQAALASVIAFTAGAAIPLLAGVFIAVYKWRVVAVVLATTFGLALFGFLGAALGGARICVGATRVVLGGWLAMALTYAIGLAFGSSGAA